MEPNVTIRKSCRLRQLCHGVLAGLFLYAGLLFVLCMSVLAEETVPFPADGSYSVESFSYEGGTGRLTIECSRVTVENGEAVGELRFSSQHISYVKADGEQYDPVSVSEEGTLFEIPVLLGKEQTIIACTTAMSQPHEIEYTIFCTVKATDTSVQEETGEVSAGMERAENAETENAETEETADTSSEQPMPEPAAVTGLVPEGEISFSYAENVRICTYEGGYRLIIIRGDDTQYLTVPEGAEIPVIPEEGVTVLRQPLSQIYIAATASMALVKAVDALENVAYSSLQAEGWYVEEAAAAMEAGSILYAGKYSQPDYELLLSGECDLAVESTMILHAPEVKEMLEGLGIPVFIDRSSYENHPLGRTEWVKVYGVMTGREEAAEAFFASQTEVLDQLENVTNTGKTAAFFSVNGSGTVVIRSTEDYIPKMIELAGGNYVPADLDVPGEENRSTVSITMEEFYAAVRDADYLVYNSTIEAPIEEAADLLDKSPLFADFKAVQEGNVWCTDKYLYQATDIVGQLIMDFHYMLEGEDEEKMTFLHRVATEQASQ